MQVVLFCEKYHLLNAIFSQILVEFRKNITDSGQIRGFGLR